MFFFSLLIAQKSQRGILNPGEISKRFCPHCVERSHVYPQVSIRPPYSPAADHRPYRLSWPRSWEMINDSENSSLTNKRRSLDLALIFNDNLPTPTYTYVPSTRAVGTRGVGNCPSRFWFLICIELRSQIFSFKMPWITTCPLWFSRVSYRPEYEHLKLDLASLEQNVSRCQSGGGPAQHSHATAASFTRLFCRLSH